jgi:predicted nucleic acid-binding protein
MSAEVFVDTNILVYANDHRAGAKHERAKQVLKSIWERKNGATSTQVLQEFYSTVTRKIPNPLSCFEARRMVSKYRGWTIYRSNVDDILLASELAEHGRFSFWDALVVQSALGCGADVLLTEDLHDGLRINSLVVQNPFAAV